MKAFTTVSVVFCGAAFLLGEPAGGAEEEDGQFVVRAVAITTQQSKDAGAAAHATQRSAISSTAQSIARDQSRARRQLTSLAAKKGLVLPERNAQPAELAASDADRIARLLTSGEEAVAVFHQEAVRGTDPELRHFAEASLTSLQQTVVQLRTLQESFPAAPMPAVQSD